MDPRIKLSTEKPSAKAFQRKNIVGSFALLLSCLKRAEPSRFKQEKLSKRAL
jgi:hypothetical protein